VNSPLDEKFGVPQELPRLAYETASGAMYAATIEAFLRSAEAASNRGKAQLILEQQQWAGLSAEAQRWTFF
jgi:hypothetical protein